MGTWSIPIDRLIAKAGGDMETAIRLVTYNMYAQVINMSAVDTGRYKINWQPSYGAPITTPIDGFDKGGEATIAKMEAAVKSFPIGGTTFLSNALPYAYRLEYDGWSTQMPMGSVRVTARTFDESVKSAIAK